MHMRTCTCTYMCNTHNNSKYTPTAQPPSDFRDTEESRAAAGNAEEGPPAVSALGETLTAFASPAHPKPSRRISGIDSKQARTLTLSQLPLENLGSLEQSLPREGIGGQVERRRLLIVLRLE